MYSSTPRITKFVTSNFRKTLVLHIHLRCNISIHFIQEQFRESAFIFEYLVL